MLSGIISDKNPGGDDIPVPMQIIRRFQFANNMKRVDKDIENNQEYKWNSTGKKPYKKKIGLRFWWFQN